MHVSTTMGHMPKNTVIMLCGACSSNIYQKTRVHTVH